jgi:hypothetical protein
LSEGIQKGFVFGKPPNSVKSGGMNAPNLFVFFGFFPCLDEDRKKEKWGKGKKGGGKVKEKRKREKRRENEEGGKRELSFPSPSPPFFPPFYPFYRP